MLEARAALLGSSVPQSIGVACQVTTRGNGAGLNPLISPEPTRPSQSKMTHLGPVLCAARICHLTVLAMSRCVVD
jgi:hypothetical protein